MPWDLAAGRVAPVPVHIIQAGAIGDDEIKRPQLRHGRDLPVDLLRSRVVGDAESNGVHVCHGTEIAKQLLADHSVLRAVGIDVVDEIAFRHKQPESDLQLAFQRFVYSFCFPASPVN